MDVMCLGEAAFHIMDTKTKFKKAILTEQKSNKS